MASETPAMSLSPGQCRRAFLFAATNTPTDQVQAKFDLGIWHTLFNWSILTVAVTNQWGGPDSSDKRDWLAGQISELFANEAQTDTDDVEVVLLQVLEDEFGIRLEDESEVPVAKDIFKLWKEVGEGDFSTVEQLQSKWEARKGKEVATGNVQVRESNQEGEWDSVDEESDEDEDGDVEMGDAPALAPAKPKAAPEVDADGFTKVAGKKRR
jgi:pre-rRNA-processing protein TSR2